LRNRQNKQSKTSNSSSSSSSQGGGGNGSVGFDSSVLSDHDEEEEYDQEAEAEAVAAALWEEKAATAKRFLRGLCMRVFLWFVCFLRVSLFSSLFLYIFFCITF
jgi:hypothetical protein